MEKVRVSYRLTPEAKRLLEAIARTLGISETAVIQVMIHERAAALRLTTAGPSTTGG